MDTNALSLNGHGVQYKPINNNNNSNNMNNQSLSGNASSPIMTSPSSTSPFQQQVPQFHFNNTQSFQNVTIKSLTSASLLTQVLLQFAMGVNRSTTPTDSCSAPTSPASQNISPSNSPELPINSNGANKAVPNQQFNNNAYSPYSNQQANILQHQLEQFRMTNETDTSNFMVNNYCEGLIDSTNSFPPSRHVC